MLRIHGKWQTQHILLVHCSCVIRFKSRQFISPNSKIRTKHRKRTQTFKLCKKFFLDCFYFFWLWTVHRLLFTCALDHSERIYRDWWETAADSIFIIYQFPLLLMHWMLINKSLAIIVDIEQWIWKWFTIKYTKPMCRATNAEPSMIS